MTTVTFEHITKRYPGRAAPVLDGFSLTVPSGELVALLGPSGSGKSTLLKLAAGLEQPDAGDICFDGHTQRGLPPNRRAAVLMFQKAYLFPFLNVADNIAFGLKVQGLPKAARTAAVSDMLALMGLSGFERRRPGELSGGEQQRVALARALVTRPKVLLLDEPFSSLDTPVRLGLQEAVQAIQRELGVTTILVTHDLDEAMAMAARLALLLDGKLVAYERPPLLFQHPPCVAAAKFVGVTTFLPGEVCEGWLTSPLGRLRINDETRRGRALYAIRPEHVRIEREPGENTLPGVVQGSIYRGEVVEYQVAVGGLTLRARVPAAAEPIPGGAAVQVTLPREHLFAVREE